MLSSDTFVIGVGMRSANRSREVQGRLFSVDRFRETITERPAIVCRWEEQTSKGIMWRDIELGEWLFNLDEATEISGIVPVVLAVAKDPAAVAAKAMKAKSLVLQRQYETMQTLANSL
jgi:hypothetical protein